MVVDSDRERLFRDVLSNNVLVERAPNFCRLRHPDAGRLAPRIFIELLIEDAFANVDATVADINARPGN